MIDAALGEVLLRGTEPSTVFCAANPAAGRELLSRRQGEDMRYADFVFAVQPIERDMVAAACLMATVTAVS